MAAMESAAMIVVLRCQRPADEFLDRRGGGSWPGFDSVRFPELLAC
jgi:hypothetical protein